MGRNFVEHIEELGNEVPEDMVLFVKPNSALSTTLCADEVEPIHYEAEISFLYQHGNFVAVALGLDLTKRELQGRLKAKGLPWERAKSFDGAALFSPFVEFADPSSRLQLALSINGTSTQVGGVEMMIYKPDDILTEIQSFMSLEDGDIVMTGTPKGVGVVTAGDTFVGEIIQDEKVLTEAEWVAF